MSINRKHVILGPQKGACGSREDLTKANTCMALQMEVRIAINCTSHRFGHASPSSNIAAQCASPHIGIARHRTPCRIASHRIASRRIASHRIAGRLQVTSHRMASHRNPQLTSGRITRITSHNIALHRHLRGGWLVGWPADQPASQQTRRPTN